MWFVVSTGLAAIVLAAIMLVPAGTSVAAANVTSEQLTLNAFSASSTGLAGPVSTDASLTSGTTYTVTVSGTYSAYASSLMNGGDGYHMCGTAVNTPDGFTGQDAAFIFAKPIEHQKETCPTIPFRHGNFVISTAGPNGPFTNLEPDGAPTEPTSDNTYTYTLTGAGEPASFAIRDSNTTDNYGALNITVSPAPTAPISGGGATAGAPVDITLPVISGTPQPGDTLSCSTGTWTNNPTSYAYQWYLDGQPITGATGSTYVVTIGDEATSPTDTLTCGVIASNASGAGAQAVSAGVLVAVPGSSHCPVPTGRVSGTSVGVLKLGMAQAKARHLLPRFTVTHNHFDNFCLFAGWGIRVAYPTKSLLSFVSAATSKSIKGRIVLALTANPFYNYHGIKPGAKVSALAKKVKLARVFHVGSNTWYLALARPADGIFKVRHGVIHEIGLVSRTLATTRKAQARMLRTFNGG